MDLQITSYQPQKIARGGYLISRKPGPVPPGCRLILGVSTAGEDHVDVTGSLARDMIDVTNMASLLRIFQKHGWPQKLALKLLLIRNGRVERSSAPFEIPGPVEPHTGPLLPLPEKWRRAYKYLFMSKEVPYAARGGHTRALAEVPGLGGMYFWTDLGDCFEADPNYRGFSCVGYVAAVCGVRSAAFWGSGDTALGKLDGKLGVTSADILKYLGTPGVEMRLTDKSGDEVVKFFGSGRPGYFIVWRQGAHTTMVTNQTVHEFNIGGYKESPLSPRVKRPADGWSVAELLAKPVLAE